MAWRNVHVCAHLRISAYICAEGGGGGIAPHCRLSTLTNIDIHNKKQ